ncbi:probable zinc metallopeptidase EGY3, chloroplastic [Syzygium oleosum]|uniref:probable zinc metallopeptidase EGY3, chloroplastic n=1 Tax=Syzygium oleosum TaxID=219896 RepID=UPI0024BBB194|nr:probable zinc metallopeptidase EGY3, chloroplastic [Syzygium oleosum]
MRRRDPRFGDGGIFTANLRRPIEEVIPKLESKPSEAAGREVVVWFTEEKADDITKQACVVQPKSEMDLQLESTRLSTPGGYASAVALRVTTFGTIALMSGFFLRPDATFDDYLSDVVPLFGGFISILGVSEIATRVTAAR